MMAIRAAVPSVSWFLILASALGAQQPPAGAGDAADHEALRGLKAVYERAVSENKLELLEPHLLPEWSGVMVTGEVVGGTEDARKYWAKIRGMMGEGGKYTVKLIPDTSLILGDVALAKGTTEDVVVTGGGTEYRFGSAWTAVCRKVGGQWKILRIQGSMDPIGNPFVRATVKGTATFAGAVAGIVGLALGVAICAIIDRRRSRRAGAPSP
jgi:ketosteroid isomerase-like protein